MKIRLKATGDVRDVSNDVGEMMSSADLADILTPVEANNFAMSVKPIHFLNWGAAQGDELADGAYLGAFAPILRWRCQECGQITYYRPTDKPAALSIFHFGHQECPKDVAKAYLNFFAAWVKRSDKRMKDSRQLMLESAFKDEDNRLARLKAGGVVTL